MTGQHRSTGGAEAAREAARRRNGEFGTQERAEAPVDLAETASASGNPAPGDPATSAAVRSLIRTERTIINAAFRATRPTLRGRGDPVGNSRAQGRADVLREVAILATTDCVPDYNHSSDFRRIALDHDGWISDRGHRVVAPPMSGAEFERHAISPRRAAAIRDFCFEQAARFACDTWGSPRPDERVAYAYLDEVEWGQMQEDRAYAVGLTEAYAHWALVFHTGTDADASDHGDLLRALYDRQMPQRPGWTPRPDERDHSAAWAATTGLGANVSEAWS